MEPLRPFVVQKRAHNIRGLAGVIYFKDAPRLPKKAVLILHAFLGDKEVMPTLASILVKEGYFVYSIDLPGHCQTEGEFSLGLASECISLAVRELRTRFSMRKIGVIGHSAGATSTMFAIFGYNSDVERNIYNLANQYALLLVAFAMGGLNYNMTLTLAKKIEERFRDIEDLISTSLDIDKLESSKIDAIVLLSPPKRFQVVFPTALSRIMSKLPKRFLKRILNSKRRGEMGLGMWGTEDIYKFLAYIGSIRSPFDYLNLLNFFAELPHPNKKAIFVRDKLALPIPKLVCYGTLDILTRPFREESYESVFAMLGNARIASFKGLSHWLNTSYFDMKQGGTHPKVVDAILQFLKANLRAD